MGFCVASTRKGRSRGRELQRGLIEHADAGDVGGEQVRRELDAAKGAPQAARQRLGEGRLADAGHVLDEHMPLAEEGDEQQLDDVVHAHDDAGHVLAHAPARPLDRQSIHDGVHLRSDRRR
jgi:hypothetical protein